MTYSTSGSVRRRISTVSYTHLLSLRREAREITAVIQILGTTRQGLYESREALCRVLSPDLAADGESRARLVYENDHGAWWTWAVSYTHLDVYKRQWPPES